MDENRLLSLLEKYIEGALDDAERGELERAIIDSPQVRHTFWQYLEQHAAIGELRGEARGRALAGLEKPPTRRRSVAPRASGHPWLLPMVIAAAVLIGMVVLFGGSHADPAPPRAPSAKREEPRTPERQVVQAPAPVQPRTPEPPRRPVEDPVERKRRIDEELKTAVKEQPAVVVPPKPDEPKPEPAPAPEKKTVVMATTVAKVVRIQGTVSVRDGQELAAGEGIETGAASLVEIAYPDGTRVAFGSGTVVKELKAADGKRFSLERGEMRAVVAKQPKGQPLVIDSAAAETTVIGTTLRLKVDAGTRLEVEEGVVSIKNKLTGKTVTVESGHYAVAVAGADLKSLHIPIDEILLSGAQGKISGGEWKVAKGGLESVPAFRPTVDPAQVTSFVTFTFEAEANRDYHLWVRGTCIGTTGDRALQDGLLLKFARAQVVQPKTDKSWPYITGPDGAGLAGWGRYTGPRWIGGDGDSFLPDGSRVDVPSQGRPGDEMPATVRFARPGPQTLRIYVLEGPMRVDAIWLSTTQKTRPEPDQQGPAKR